MRTIYLYFLACLIISVGTGCASTRQSMTLPDLKVEIENPEMARIYLIRDTSLGSAISINIYDDNNLVGSTGPNGYLCWEREPGETEIFGKAENKSTVYLDADPGKIYYIKQHIQMGLLMARNKLELLNEEKGKKILKKCKPPKIENK